MILKIFIYYVIIFGTLFLERQFQIVQTKIRPDLFYGLVYLIFYLLLFGLELKSRQSEKHRQSLKKAGFLFSFWVGMSWGMFITFMKGYPKIYGYIDILQYVLGCVIFGLLVGGIGVLLTPLYLIYIFGEDQNHNNV